MKHGKRKGGRKGPGKHLTVNQLMGKRASLLFALMLLAGIIIIIRMVSLKVLYGEENERAVLEKRNLENRSIPFRRGEITDRNGVVLAKSLPAFRLVMDFKELTLEFYRKNKLEIPNRLKTDDYEGITLADISPDWNKNDSLIVKTFNYLEKKFHMKHGFLEKKYREKPMNAYFLTGYILTYEEGQSVKKRQADEKYEISRNGINLEPTYRRVYPYKELGAQVIGYTTRADDGRLQGARGIEAYYESELQGDNGREFEYIDPEYGVLKKRVEPTDGNTVMLSLDIGVQTAITDAMKAYLKDHPLKNMAILAMNPSNGEVLGMASSPFYDPNQPDNMKDVVITEDMLTGNRSGKPVEKKWDDLTTDEKARVKEAVRSNYCISTAFEPGSTFKPVTVAAGLELKKFQIDTTFNCDGGQMISGQFIGCSNRQGHGTLTAAQAIEVSCNDALMQMAELIGPDKFLDYQHIFNFGRITGIDLPGEVGGPNSLHTKGMMSPLDLATNSFGQNFDVNMLQLACADAAIGNGGKYYRPRMMSEIRDSKGGLVRKSEPELERQVVSAEVADEVKNAMRMMVEEGGMQAWTRLKGFEREVFGKTGTAEKQPRSRGKFISSFIEMAPYDEPQLLLYVILDEPEDAVVGTVDATKISSGLMVKLLPALGISGHQSADDKENTTGQQSDPGAATEQPQPSGQPTGAEQPQPAGQPTGAEQPQPAGQPTGAEQPQPAEQSTGAEQPQPSGQQTGAEQPQPAEQSTGAEQPQPAGQPQTSEQP